MYKNLAFYFFVNYIVFTFSFFKIVEGQMFTSTRKYPTGNVGCVFKLQHITRPLKKNVDFIKIKTYW